MIDLHLHSTASDGAFTPSELVRWAATRGLSAIALTDHDTLDGVPEAVEEGSRLGIEVVAGVELAVAFSPGTFHLIGLLVDPLDGPLESELARVREGRSARNSEMIRKLSEMGVPLRIEEVRARAGGDVVGRPHMAQILVERGYAKSFKHAFDRYLGKGGPAYVGRHLIPVGEAIRLVHGAGGVAVLCHPTTLGLEGGGPSALREFARDLAAQGLDAIECDYPDHTPSQRRLYRAIAGEFDLLESGGSDFHGLSKKDAGTGGSPAHSIQDGVLEALRERAGRYRG